jgi:hypothetical protein
MVTRQELVEAVKEYAAANYNKDGWDYIVETYDDAQIDKAIGQARTANGAIKKVRWVATLLDDRRRDIEATAF